METLNKLFEWSKTLPFWLRSILYVLVAAIALIVSFSMSSCGTPKTVATVHNVNPNSTVSVSMSVSNSTTSTPTVETTPSIDLSR